MAAYLTVLAVAGVISLVLATFVAFVLARLGFPLSPDDKRLGSIDGLRGYLALLVVIHHFIIWIQTTRLGGSWSRPPIDFLNQLGSGAVGLFFMTTGFVFYPRILQGYRAVPWKSVYITRIFRIVPLIVFSVMVITAIIMARTGTVPGSDYLFAAATWISTWGEPPLLGYPDSGRLNAYVLWSLWYEWLFYLLVLPISAVAMDFARGRGLPSWSIPAGLFAVGVFVQVLCRQAGLPPSIFRYLPLFASGMLAYEIRSWPGAAEIFSRPTIGPIAVIGLLLGMILSPDPYGTSLPLFAFFFICAAAGTRFAGLLSNPGALVLGDCSYAVYLLHGVVLSILFTDLSGMVDHIDLFLLPLFLIFILFFVVLLASASYIAIERPAIRVGKAIARRVTDQSLRFRIGETMVAP